MLKAAPTSVPASSPRGAAPFFRKQSGIDATHDSDSDTPFFAKTKASVSKNDDPLEREADTMADRVIQKMSDNENNASIEKNKSAAVLLQQKCEGCDEKEQLQKKEDKQGFDQDHSGPGLMQSLDSTSTGGFALPADIRTQMETSFNADFSKVRIHTDNQAVQMSKTLKAQAFTTGNHIYFNACKYDPLSTPGKFLLAHELTHTLQQGTSVTRKPEVQLYPQAGFVNSTTEKQKRYESHRDDVVDIHGMESFSPNSGLGNYISAMWEAGQEVAVNIKYGSLAAGFIFVKPTGRYVNQECITVPVSLILDVKICKDEPPDPVNYEAKTHVIPFQHEAFNTKDKGSLGLTVKISKGFIFGKVGWVEGKSFDAVDPVMDAENVKTDEVSFLPLIYGDEYTGSNFKSIVFENIFSKGRVKFNSMGNIELANNQTIEGNSLFYDLTYVWFGHLKGRARGTDDYDMPVERNSKGALQAESLNLHLDKQWVSGNKDTEHGYFEIQGSLRASYKNRTFDIAGKATYTSSRIHGEVNISVTTESQAMELFEQHAPAKKVPGGVVPETGVPTSAADDSGEPLAITAWGNMRFRLMGDNGAKAAPAGGGGAPPSKAKQAIMNLEGEGAFAVSPDGYIVLAGKLKFPYIWKFTDKLEYTTADADDKDKHLFSEEVTAVRAPVPYGTVNLELGIVFDVGAQLNPLYLYEIEVAGVYSNHPQYRSELGITPKLYISGSANAKLTATAKAAYKLGGLISVGSVTGAISATALFNAYINAAPTVKIIWDGSDKAADYALAGAIHAGGQLTFHVVVDDIDVEILFKKVWSSGKFKIGSWTLGSFGIQLLLNDYILGSGEKPQIDFSKMGFGEKERNNLASAIAHEKDSKVTDDKQSGGLTQKEDGKDKEKGSFSKTDTSPKDLDTEPIVPYTVNDEFVMLDKVHELDVTISGTRGKPKAVLEMASGPKEPIQDKIEDEKVNLYLKEYVVDKDDEAVLRLQEHDLVSIEKEAKSVENSAEKTAEKAVPGEETEIAGVKQLEQHLTDYSKKYNTSDLGQGSSTPTPPPSAKPTLSVPKSNGATPEMESKLADKRADVGYETFENFRRSNVAIFRYYVQKPGSTFLDRNKDDGPFYETAVNKKSALHSEIIIAGMLQKIHSSKKFRKKYGPTHIIVVDQILTERSPCSQCRSFLENTKSSLIKMSNFHTYYVVHYSGYWVERNRTLMIKYGLEPPSLKELTKQYGGGDIDPH